MIAYQQHPFFFLSAFLSFNFWVFTSTGMNLLLWNNYISSCLFSTEAKAMTSKAAATPSLFLALVWRCFIFGCLAKNSLTAYYYTSLYSLLSILFPTKMKGNFYGYLGAPWFRNYWIHDSILSNDWKIETKVPSC